MFEVAQYMEAKEEVVSDLIFGDSFIRLTPSAFNFEEYIGFKCTKG